MQLLDIWDLQWSEEEPVTINLLSTAKLNSYFLEKKRNLKMNSNIFIAMDCFVCPTLENTPVELGLK